MASIIYSAAKPIVAASLHLLCRWKVTGKIDRLPDDMVIVVSNHLSWVDIPLLGVSLPRRIVFMGKKEYYRSPFHRFLMRTLGGFTVERGTADMTAFRMADEALRSGCVLGIFPEGTRSRTFQLQPGHRGTAYVALRNNAYILPVGISGTEKIRQRYENDNKMKLFYRPEVTVNMGEPFKLPQVDGRPGRAELTSSTETIMRQLAQLLPDDYRGVYGNHATD